MHKITEELQGLKWEILKELSKKNCSPLELSKKIGKSLPNISQQLKLLEALNYVSRKQLNNNEKNRPRVLYSLKKNITFITLLEKEFADKKIFELSSQAKTIIKILFYYGEETTWYLGKLVFDYTFLFEEENAVSILDANTNKIKILVISKKKYELIYKMSNAKLNVNEKEVKIETLIYRIEDFEGTTLISEEAKKDMLKGKIIFDPISLFNKIKI